MEIAKEICEALDREITAQVDINIMKSMGYWQPVELLVDTGTVFGQTYHTVEPRNLEWQDSREMWDSMMLWCHTTFGADSSVWRIEPNQRWYANAGKFWFLNKQDLAWFMLRWA